jgi:hypothetical protein
MKGRTETMFFLDRAILIVGAAGLALAIALPVINTAAALLLSVANVLDAVQAGI